ncbi:hypothetical protein D3C81_2248680 [compost metagenome]
MMILFAQLQAQLLHLLPVGCQLWLALIRCLAVLQPFHLQPLLVQIIDRRQQLAFSIGYALQSHASQGFRAQ